MEWNVKAVRQKRIKLDLKRVIYVLLGFALLFGGVISQHVWELMSVKEALHQADSRVELLQQEKAKLQRERQALGQLEHVEKVAREDYNMVKQDEIPVFILKK